MSRKSSGNISLEHKKTNDCFIFHSCKKTIASDSDIDKAFKSMIKHSMKNELHREDGNNE